MRPNQYQGENSCQSSCESETIYYISAICNKQTTKDEFLGLVHNKGENSCESSCESETVSKCLPPQYFAHEFEENRAAVWKLYHIPGISVNSKAARS